MRKLITVLVICVTTPARADVSGFVHLHSARIACLGVLPNLTDCIELPSGYFFDDPSYTKLEDELKRLQDVETRLTAENNALKTTVASWEPGWFTLATTLVVGVVAGIYLDRKL